MKIGKVYSESLFASLSLLLFPQARSLVLCVLAEMIWKLKKWETFWFRDKISKWWNSFRPAWREFLSWKRRPCLFLDVTTLSFTSLGVTPVDGMPHRPYAECYPVLLDGVMVGWVDKELAASVAASLRHFKVTMSVNCSISGSWVLVLF